MGQVPDLPSRLNRLSIPFWLISTEWIGRQRVPGSAKRPRSRSAAKRVILAVPAPVLKRHRIVQRLERRMIAINIRNLILANVADYQRKESSRTDIASMRDKHDAVSITDAESPVSPAAFDLLPGHSGGFHFLQRHATVRRSLGRRDCERRRKRCLVDPTHQLFAIFRRQRLQDLTAPDRNEEEQAPARNIVRLQKLIDRRNVIGGLRRGKSVHL